MADLFPSGQPEQNTKEKIPQKGNTRQMGLTTVCVAARLRCPSKAWDPTVRRCANMSVRVLWKGELPVNTACGSPFEVSRAQAC